MANQSASVLTVGLELRVAAGQPILARLRFTNSGSQPYELLSWLTFRSGRIDAKYFNVTFNDQPARYIGIMKKRGPPTAKDYLVLKPGEERTSVVSLSEAYAIAGPGVLTVTYDTVNPGLAKGSPGDRLVSNTISARIE